MMVDTPWHTLAGGEYYDMKNPDLAKQKLQEAGYDGEPIRFLTTQEFSSYYGVSVVAKQQMESIGIKVDFRVTDWATVVEQRAKPDAWDMFATNHGDSSNCSFRSDKIKGWTDQIQRGIPFWNLWLEER
jgi:peptide/nickel transport system substrate-binding protein